MKRARGIVVVAALAAALVSGGWLLQRGLQHAGSAAGGAQLFDQVLQHVENDYVDSVADGALYLKATAGMVHLLNDPHSAYLDSTRLASLTESTSGTYAGLGIQIDVRDGWITIIAPLPGTPAERAGIQSGDRIVAVNGKSSEGWTADEARDALRGRAGTKVSLLIERPGVATRLPFELSRADVHVRSVRHPVMLTDHVGYVDLTIFGDSSGDELRNAIGGLVRQGMTTLLFDLRSNPGGLLEQGVDIAGMFLDRGQRIVSMRGRTATATNEFVNRSRQLWPRLQMITLVDGHSASAAEIVAGALQDHDRSVLVGATTYGKGSAQSLFPLGVHDGALKLTTARWYTPSGRSIQKALEDTTTGDGGPPADTAAERPLSQREAYRTDAGRVVYGGGGITPDLIVSAVDSGDGTLAFFRALGPDVQRFRDALTDYALQVKGARAVTAPGFAVTPAMRDALWRLLAAKGVRMQRAQYDAAAPQVDRILGGEIAQFVFGSDAAFRRGARTDRVIAAALSLANGATSEQELLQRAAALRAARREDVRHQP